MPGLCIENEIHAFLSPLTQEKTRMGFFMYEKYEKNWENWENWGILPVKRIKMYNEP